MNLLSHILEPVNEWLAFAEEVGIASESDLMRLERLLDALALSRHSLGEWGSMKTEDGQDVPKSNDAATLWKQFTDRFPMLDMYNIPSTVTTNLGQEQTMMCGHAIDDLVDITSELRSVRWLISQDRPGDACWEFAFGYDQHWRRHLRGLLWYLEMRRIEST